MLILVGISDEDTAEDIDWLVRKSVGLRIFDDAQGVMNLDIRQVHGEILAVSQFTLMASTKRGNRPSYIRAAGEATALPLYHTFTEQLSQALGRPVATGVFGADMQVELVNDGPVTIWIDSHNRE
jgi:D-tyrosyl-tRNA(Tyr) deacylase